jgi:23S rRNA pseudouridine2605 synthase
MKPPTKPPGKSKSGGPGSPPSGPRATKKRDPNRPPPGPKKGSYSQRLISASKERLQAEREAKAAAAAEAGSRLARKNGEPGPASDRPRSERRREERGEASPDRRADRDSDRGPGRAPDRGSDRPDPRRGSERGERSRFRVAPKRGPELLGEGEVRRGVSKPSRAQRQQAPQSARPTFSARGRDRNRDGDDEAVSPAPRRGGPTMPATGRPTEPMRIAKAMARAGLCSRREAERWIADGRVSVNGRVLDTPALEVTPRDIVKVDGNLLPASEPARLWRYHKPKGLVTTHSDPEGRETVFEALPADLPRVVSVGRLDYNSEGLLLLTNDGELARHFELPSTGWLRRYRVRAYGRLTQSDLDTLKDGITVEGITYGPIEATLDSVQSGNMWLTMGLREGKNREVRKILGHLGLEVNRLIRISYGPFQLLDLEPGAVEHVRRRVLADQLGPTLTREFGLDQPEADAPPARPDRRDGRRPSFRVRPK